MGNHIAADREGRIHISYYTESELRHAYQENGAWKVEKVDEVSRLHANREYRSTLVFDKEGFPHISYEDLEWVKHAYWDGNRWRSQGIAQGGSVPFRDSSMAIDKKRDILYICYRDGTSGALQVAIGRMIEVPQTATEIKKENKE